MTHLISNLLIFHRKIALVRLFISEIPMLLSSAGYKICLNPSPSAAFMRCLVLVTGRISPARLNSPKIEVSFFTAISVLAE